MAWLGGRVSNENVIMQSAEPRTMGATGRKPKTVTLAVVRSKRCPSAGKIRAMGCPGFGAMGSERCCKYQVPASQAATQRVEARAPYLVLLFQNNAAIMTGAIAAKPEKAKRTANSKMLSGVMSAIK